MIKNELRQLSIADTKALMDYCFQAAYQLREKAEGTNIVTQRQKWKKLAAALEQRGNKLSAEMMQFAMNVQFPKPQPSLQGGE